MLFSNVSIYVDYVLIFAFSTEEMKRRLSSKNWVEANKRPTATGPNWWSQIRQDVWILRLVVATLDAMPLMAFCKRNFTVFCVSWQIYLHSMSSSIFVKHYILTESSRDTLSSLQKVNLMHECFVWRLFNRAGSSWTLFVTRLLAPSKMTIWWDVTFISWRHSLIYPICMNNELWRIEHKSINL